MDRKILFPKTVEDLLEKLEYTLKQEQNLDLINDLTKVKKWFCDLKYELNYVCSDNEYLKLFITGEDYALQVWEHGDLVDSIKFNLISNFPSIYNTDKTLTLN